jgi:DNA mismatch endonuclease (patch repair protein)
MADKISAERRSNNMRAIRSANTKIELALRRALRERGLTGYRVHRRDIAGRPDVAFIGLRVAVFVDGCFWHGCPECYVAPSTQSAYWKDKLARNQARDAAATAALEAGGWEVLRFWEHEVEADASECAARVEEAVAASRKRRAGRPAAD